MNVDHRHVFENRYRDDSAVSNDDGEIDCGVEDIVELIRNS